MRTKYTILYFFVAILTLGGALSCSDFLTEDPRGQMATANFFKSENDLDAALTALYSLVTYQNDANNEVGTEAQWGDDISTHPASNKVNLREYDQYNVSENQASWMPRLWKARYQIIKGANFIINNAPDCENTSKAKITMALANAYYWRAFNYFYLVTTWGEVPLILNEEITLDVQLSSVEEIYEQIISDLEKAEEGCPDNYTTEPYARNGINIAVSKGAVKATMAYVYMAMAGWPMNKTEYYKQAAAKAKEVIDGVNSGKYYYSLLPEYRLIHSQEWNDKNPETLLGIYYNRITKKTQSPVCDILDDMGGWNDTNGEIKFWKEFPEGPRKEATYFPKIFLKAEVKAGNPILRDWWENPTGGRPVVAPVFMKTVESSDENKEYDYTNHEESVPSNGNKHHQVIRLAEVYCWYAEAVGRSGEVNQLAVDVLNKVRNRADGINSNIYSTSMSPAELAEAAWKEHGWEIAGYYWCGFATRARDMFRMYRYKDHFEFRVRNPEIEVAPGVFRKEAVPVTGTWSDKKMYAPRPYVDNITLNPNLANN
ncbi:MAG: RagB/SusD family nutrient uptake outer membrane protein [Fermentimonas sp.]|jgi:hypothetical protein